MIYNPEIGMIKIPWNNDTTEEMNCFNAHAGGRWNLTVQCIVNKQIWKLYILGIRCGH